MISSGNARASAVLSSLSARAEEGCVGAQPRFYCEDDQVFEVMDHK